MWKELLMKDTTAFFLKNATYELLSKYFQPTSETSNNSFSRKEVQKEFHQQFHVVLTYCWENQKGYAQQYVISHFPQFFLPLSAFLVNILVNCASFLKSFARFQNCIKLWIIKNWNRWHHFTVHRERTTLKLWTHKFFIKITPSLRNRCSAKKN